MCRIIVIILVINRSNRLVPLLINFEYIAIKSPNHENFTRLNPQITPLYFLFISIHPPFHIKHSDKYVYNRCNSSSSLTALNIFFFFWYLLRFHTHFFHSFHITFFHILQNSVNFTIFLTHFCALVIIVIAIAIRIVVDVIVHLGGSNVEIFNLMRMFSYVLVRNLLR